MKFSGNLKGYILVNFLHMDCVIFRTKTIRKLENSAVILLYSTSKFKLTNKIEILSKMRNSTLQT